MAVNTKQTSKPYVPTHDTGHSESSRRWARAMWRRYWRTLDTPKGRRAHYEALQRCALLDLAAQGAA